ncbi:hypothetical protein HPB49_020479 [Dermacentor silvarum]|uniref:Uncharacterized protein n=1 Tax=Dermacentor silvarum TaxID=543639 RepID=A0ACB8CZS2_DERSI|nr:hypothetical protein HPB49_020479 [Dermacentor silvarum]
MSTRAAMAEDVAQPEPAERAADPQRLEASRIQWLTRAMQELLVNPYDEMRRSLRNIRECLRESHNIGRVLVACIANVQQFIDVVDYAKDFEKMGGFQVLPELLDYPSSLVRVGTCALIAELVQNNPHCQRAALRSASRLLRLLNTETDDEVRCKSLYALSCMVRQNKDAYANFEKLGGPVVLRRVLFETTNRSGQASQDQGELPGGRVVQPGGRLPGSAGRIGVCSRRRRACFRASTGDCRQFLLSALLSLATHSVQPLLGELPKVREALVATLAGFIREHGDAAQFQEEVQYSTEILDLLKDRGQLPRIIALGSS